MYLQRLAQRSLHFAQRQTHDFKLMLGRRTLHGLATGLTTQYSSLYATLLGANAVQLGSLQSAGNAVATRDQERLEGTQPGRDSQRWHNPGRPRR